MSATPPTDYELTDCRHTATTKFPTITLDYGEAYYEQNIREIPTQGSGTYFLRGETGGLCIHTIDRHDTATATAVITPPQRLSSPGGRPKQTIDRSYTTKTLSS